MVCAAPLIREVSIALVRLGMDRPPTIRTIESTTMSSANVKPDCKARLTPDLAEDFTIFCTFPLAAFYAKTSLRLVLTLAVSQHMKRLRILAWSVQNLRVNT